MIRYKIYQNKHKEGVNAGKWFARSVSDETFDLTRLSEHMSGHNSPYSPGVIRGVLTDMVRCIKELLLDGKNVKIDDLAIFSVGIHSKGADRSVFSRPQHLRRAPACPCHGYSLHDPSQSDESAQAAECI